MSNACAFCAIAGGEASAHRVLTSDDVVAFLDRRPLFPGHVLVVPAAHHATLIDLPAALVTTVFGQVQRLAAALPRALGAEGTFVAVNNVVSQSVAHLHVHVVPRTKGDGLRGFFWPRQHYGSDDEMTEVAARISAALLDT